MFSRLCGTSAASLSWPFIFPRGLFDFDPRTFNMKEVEVKETSDYFPPVPSTRASYLSPEVDFDKFHLRACLSPRIPPPGDNRQQDLIASHPVLESDG